MSLPSAPSGRALRPLGRACLTLGLLAAPLAAEQARVVLEPAGASKAAAPARVVAEAEEGGRRLEREAADGQALLELSTGVWTLRIEGDELWAPPRQVRVEPGKPGVVLEIRVPVWRLGSVAGPLAADPSPGDAPLRLAFSADADGRDSVEPAGVSTCSLAARRFTCRLPEGVSNLQFRREGFAPGYVWGVPVAAGQTVELPALRFFPGASISGLVKRPAGATAPGAPVVVTLRSPERAAIEEAPGNGSFSTQVTGRRGFYQLVQVPPGEYLIEARQGNLLSVERRVAVQRGAETTIAPALELRPAARLSVQLDPPQATGGSAWRLTVLREEGSAVTPLVSNAEARPDGTWTSPELPAGSYRVGVADAEGARWGTHSVELPGPMPVLIPIRARAVHGRLRLGRQPLAARLLFGGKGPLRITLTSDEEGAFKGLLPSDGPPGDDWPVTVEAQSPPLRRKLAAVHVPPGEGETPLDLTLPDASLHVRLFDERGRAWAERAIVTAVSDTDLPQQLTFVPSSGLDGAPGAALFDGLEMRGLTPGVVRVRASAVGAESEETVATLREDAPADVELTLKPTSAVEGQIVSEDGSPVAGATVLALPFQTPFQGIDQQTSDGGGRFRVELPRGTQVLGLGVRAGGFAYRLLRAAVEPGQPLKVTLGRAGGTLRLGLPETAPARRLDQALYLFHGGYLSDVPSLIPWAEVGGGGLAGSTLVVPRMEPGQYTLCLLDKPRVLQALAGLTPTSCASGYLPAEGELSLSGS